MKYKISVITAVYNGARFLQQMVDSLQGQTFRDFELILVNDGSTDNSLDIMNNAKKILPNVQVISYAQNKNLPSALNIALQHSQGDYVLRLDGDDLLEPDCLEKEYTFLVEHPELDGVICDELKVDADLNPRCLFLKMPEDYYIKKQNLFRPAFGGPTTMLKREKYFAVGLYDEKMAFSSDHFLAIKLHKVASFGHIPECLYIYRMHQSNISKHNKQFKSTILFKQTKNEYMARTFQKEDYINDWQMVKRFKELAMPDKEIRSIKYANIILKCALKLAELGDKQSALEELKKAEAVHPKPRFGVFKNFIKMGFKGYLQTLYVNMNLYTDYAYDDYYLVDVSHVPRSSNTKNY